MRAVALVTPLGLVHPRWRAGRLVALDLDLDVNAPAPDASASLAPLAPEDAALLARLRDWFAAYFSAPRATPAGPPDLPLAPAATPFQQRLRAALQAIPPGQTLAYGELARLLGSCPRAVGQGCRRNPLPILVPCHRVVAAGGPGGFSGATAGPRLAVKQWLLAHEGAAP